MFSLACNRFFQTKHHELLLCVLVFLLEQVDIKIPTATQQPMLGNMYVYLALERLRNASTPCCLCTEREHHSRSAIVSHVSRMQQTCA